MATKTKNLSKHIKETIGTVIASVVLVVLTMMFVAQSLEISGNSMVPTFHNSERIVVEKVSYKTSNPKRYDIVVVRSPSNDSMLLIKRVIGLPNESIKIDQNGQVFANGQLIDSNFVNTEDSSFKPAVRYSEYNLKKDEYFILGDNRNHSNDSRFFGAINKESIVGKAFFVYWPLNKIRTVQH